MNEQASETCLEDGDGLVEVVMLHGGGGVEGGDGGGGRHHELVGEAAVVDVVAETGDVESQTLNKHQPYSVVLDISN